MADAAATDVENEVLSGELDRNKNGFWWLFATRVYVYT